MTEEPHTEKSKDAAPTAPSNAAPAPKDAPPAVAAGGKGGPAPPPSGLGHVPSANSPLNVLARINPTRSTRVFLLWLAGFALVGGALFIWVAIKTCTSYAYDVITQHQSPIGSDLGVAGVLLGGFGYFVAPAIIGAVVAGLYTARSEMTAERVRTELTRIAAEAARGK